ncbi:hypothetical protein DDV98_36390 [Streptomyces sp. IB2014 011-12]|nr:hypothetical protein DDV98_36390 [Streptomyces sp. IB2014 011-12]
MFAAQVLHCVTQQTILVQQLHLAEWVTVLAAGGQERREPVAQAAPQRAHIHGGGCAGAVCRAQNSQTVDEASCSLARIACAVRFRDGGSAARGQRQVTAPSEGVPFYETHNG